MRLRATSDPLTRDLYLGHASIAAGVSRDLMEREIAAPPRSRGGRAMRNTAPRGEAVVPNEQHGDPLTPPDATRVRRGERRRAIGERVIGAERELMRVLLHRPAYFEQVVERIGPESFSDPELRRIFAAMVERGPDAGPNALAESLDGDAVVVLQEMLDETGGLEHLEETVGGSMAAMHERAFARRMEEIDALMPLADTDEKDVLTREKVQLRDELLRLGSRRFKGFSPQR